MLQTNAPPKDAFKKGLLNLIMSSVFMVKTEAGYRRHPVMWAAGSR